MPRQRARHTAYAIMIIMMPLLFTPLLFIYAIIIRHHALRSASGHVCRVRAPRRRQQHASARRRRAACRHRSDSNKIAMASLIITSRAQARPSRLPRDASDMIAVRRAPSARVWQARASACRFAPRQRRYHVMSRHTATPRRRAATYARARYARAHST